MYNGVSCHLVSKFLLSAKLQRRLSWKRHRSVFDRALIYYWVCCYINMLYKDLVSMQRFHSNTDARTMSSVLTNAQPLYSEIFTNNLAARMCGTLVQCYTLKNFCLYNLYDTTISTWKQICISRFMGVLCITRLQLNKDVTYCCYLISLIHSVK